MWRIKLALISKVQPSKSLEIFFGVRLKLSRYIGESLNLLIGFNSTFVIKWIVWVSTIVW
jgi:hypothetical protein